MNDTGHAGFAPMSARDFTALGLEQLAFVKPIVERGAIVFAIYTADGRLAATVPTREVAFATVRQNDLEPVSVH
jgi:hypothetical protein